MLEFIRRCDFFAIYVHVTYEGERKFNTLLGGSCTVALVFAIIVTFPWLMYESAVNSQFSVN